MMRKTMLQAFEDLREACGGLGRALWQERESVMRFMLPWIAVVLVVVIGACGTSTPSSPAQDATDVACDFFRTAAAENDVLTDAQMRDRLQQVANLALTAHDDVRDAARALARSAVAGAPDADDIRALDSACGGHGA